MSTNPRTEAAEGQEAVMEIIGWNNDATPRLRIYAKLHNLPAGTKLYTAPPAVDSARKPVSWARPIYATEPAEAWEPGDVIDVEFYNRAEKPEGDGWRPLVFADTGDGEREGGAS